MTTSPPVKGVASSDGGGEAIQDEHTDGGTLYRNLRMSTIRSNSGSGRKDGRALNPQAPWFVVFDRGEYLGRTNGKKRHARMVQNQNWGSDETKKKSDVKLP